MYLVINKCVKAVKVSNFSGHYLRNRSTLDIGVLVYIGIVQRKEHSPEVLSISPGTPCIQSVCWCYCHAGPVWHDSVETYRRIVIICKIFVHLLVILQNKQKSLPCLQNLATDLHYEPDKSGSSPHFPTSLRSLLILSSHTSRISLLDFRPNVVQVCAIPSMRTTFPAYVIRVQY